jgi:serine/threonine-protein kinase SRPK3
MTANTSATKGHAELHSLQSLGAHYPGSPSSKYIVQLLEQFVHKGPNGSHQCLVLELLGPSINAVIHHQNKQKQRLTPNTILKFSKQLLQAIDFMHSTGFAYGGMLEHDSYIVLYI